MNKREFILNEHDLQPLNSGPFTIPTIDDEEFSLAINEGQKSYLGTPVFSDIILRASDQSISVYMDTVLIDVTQTKNIIKTSIVGRKGTIKEYISDGDYSISIKGLLVGNNGQYPQSSVSDLIELLQLSQTLDVICPYLQLLGVYNIVVETYNLPQKQGFQNVQSFDLSCISDEPIEFLTNG